MEQVLLQYGAIGVIAVFALSAARIMFTKLSASYERERDRADRLEEELRKLNETIRGEYVSAIMRASQVMSEANRTVADATLMMRK